MSKQVRGGKLAMATRFGKRVRGLPKNLSTEYDLDYSSPNVVQKHGTKVGNKPTEGRGRGQKRGGSGNTQSGQLNKDESDSDDEFVEINEELDELELRVQDNTAKMEHEMKN